MACAVICSSTIGRSPLLLGSRLEGRAYTRVHSTTCAFCLFLSLLHSSFQTCARERVISFHHTYDERVWHIVTRVRERGGGFTLDTLHTTTAEQELLAARARTRYLCRGWEETAESSCMYVRSAFGLQLLRVQRANRHDTSWRGSNLEDSLVS